MTIDEKAREAALLERCDAAVTAARAAGADGAEAYASWTHSINVRFEKDDLKLTTVDDGASLGLRVVKDDRLGFSSTNQQGAGVAAQLARDALELASLNPPDANNRLPAASALPSRLPLVGDPMRHLPVETVVQMGREFFEQVRGIDPRVAVDQVGVQAFRTSHVVVSSTGVRAAESDAQISQMAFGMAVDGEDVGGFDYVQVLERDPKRAREAGAALARLFAQRVLGNLDAQAAESYLGPVLFAPDAFLEVFIDPLLTASSAIAVQRGRSALAGKLGQSIAAAALSVRDDPQDLELGGAATFDREGQAARPFDLVRAGALQGWLYNAYAASVDGVSSTGHATGGARSVPAIGPHALVVEAGDGGDLDAMLRRLGRGLYVQRFSGTVDPASGDFSGVAKSARWVEGGAVVRPLRETLISGNAFALLREIASISGAREICMGSARAPWVLVDGVNVTAG